MKISAIIIAKNEENLLVDCLDSVSFCDEIIVVDNGSTDRTKDVAKRFGAEVVALDEKDFSKLRNAGLEVAKNSWILYIDADERVSADLGNEIIQTVNIQSNSHAGYRLRRKNFYLGNHESPYVEKMERLFFKDKLKGWEGVLHETPVVDGKMGELQNFLLHYTHRNLEEMLKKTIEWSEIEAQLRFKAGHPRMKLWRFYRVMITAFIDSYIFKKSFRMGTVGTIESIYQSFSMFITYARLWELQQSQKK